MKISSRSRHLAWVGLIVLVNVSPALAQGPSDLQQQVDELKQQYERLTADLQRRIAALEQQLEQRKEATIEVNTATASTADDADGAGGEASQSGLFGDSQTVGAQFQGRCHRVQRMTSCRRRKPPSRSCSSTRVPSNSTGTSAPATV